MSNSSSKLSSRAFSKQSNQTYLLIVTIEGLSAVIIDVANITGEMISAVEDMEDEMLVVGKVDLASRTVRSIGIANCRSRGRRDTATIPGKRSHHNDFRLVGVVERVRKG